MIKSAIVLISILALIIDRYIYRRVIRRHNFGRVWSVGYVVYALVVDLSVVVALALHSLASEGGSTVLMKTIMMVVFLFFLNLLPKAVYVFVSLGDYIVRVYTRRRSHLFGYVGTALALVLAVVMITGATIGRRCLRVSEVVIVSDRLPQSFDGFRVVQFSDMHLGNLIGAERMLDNIVSTINSLDADIVVQSGDFVNISSSELGEREAEILSGIKSRYGVYSVLGNHDLGFYLPPKAKMTPRQEVIELSLKQRAMGWNLLVNESVHIYKGGDSISVSGINFPSDYTHNGHDTGLSGADFTATYDGVNDSTYNILISHAPQVWSDIPRDELPDLTLSGHIHAMQMKFSLGKWAWSPAQFMYDKWSGLYSKGNKHLYINDGVGYVMYPMRIGTRPEITLIELRRSEK